MAKRGLQADLRERLEHADERGLCVTATSKNDARRLNKAVLRGDLVSPAQGIYAAPDAWAEKKPTEQNLIAARTLQTLHPDWVFCGVTAAIAHGLSVSFHVVGSVHVAVSRRAHTRVGGIRGVERHVVEGDEAVEVAGVRVTSVERTAFDCMRSLGFREALAIADSALFRRLVSADALSDAFGQYPNRLEGRRRAIDTLRLADGRAESGGESVARAVMIERGFRLPDLQRKVSDVMGNGMDYRVDFYWELPESQDVIGELDGHEKYVNPAMTGGRDTLDVLADERLRESRVSGGGAKIMRFSYRQVVDRAYFTRLLCMFGVPRDAEIPWVAQRADDAEAMLGRHERLFLGRWMKYASEHGLPMPTVA